MTMMALPEIKAPFSARWLCDPEALRTWLAGRWAILFSHPDDFAQEQMEMDRWVAVLARDFSARGVRPVALERSGSVPEQGWIGRLAALDGGPVAVLTPDAQSAAVPDFSAGALRALVARGTPRFAMILDDGLHCRRTLRYRLPGDLPSPLELLGWAASLRKRGHGEERPLEAPDSSLAFRADGMGRPHHLCAPAGHHR